MKILIRAFKVETTFTNSTFYRLLWIDIHGKNMGFFHMLNPNEPFDLDERTWDLFVLFWYIYIML